MLREPAGELSGLEARRLEVEATLGHHLVLIRQCLEQPVTQHPEFQTIEELMGRLAVPRAALQIVKADGQIEVEHQRIHLPVAQHIIDPFLERLGRLALELARVCGQIFQTV